MNDERTAPQRRVEPWPWALAGMLGFMITASLAFYAVAASHPDPEVHRGPASEGVRAAAASAPPAPIAADGLARP